MKMRRIGQGLLLLIAAGMFYSEGAWAASAWYTCTIDSVGTRSVKSGTTTISQPVVQLDDVDGAFTDTDFQFHKTLKNEMLALALTALSNGFQVEIKVDMEATTKPYVINEMHLIAIP